MEYEEALELYGDSVHTTASVFFNKYKLACYPLNFDDLYQIGLLGLFDACQRYDKTKGVLFWTYAYYRVSGNIMDAIRANIKMYDKKKRFARQPVEHIDNSLHEDLEDRDLIYKVYKILPAMTWRHRVIIELYHFRRLTLREIGQVLDLSESRICHILPDAYKEILYYVQSVI